MKSAVMCVLAAGAVLVTSPALANLDLAKKDGCTGCHGVDKKGALGPAFRDVAKKYAGDKGAEAKLVEKVKKGGSGVWGSQVMPPNSPQIKDDDIKTLVKWILGGAK